MTATEHTNRQRTLAEYLAIIRRRKWALILPLLVVPIVAFGYSYRQAAVYAASSEVLISRQDLGSAISGRSNADIYSDPDRFAQTQAALARVPEVARDAVARSGVGGITPGQLLAASSVTPRGNADLLEFTVRQADAGAASTLATAYASAYTDYRLKLDTDALSGARRDLQRSIAALERQGATDTLLYRALAEKVQELRTMELLQTRAAVVRTASAGTQVAPTPQRDAILGAALGILLGLAAIFLWEALDRRVRDEDEISRALEIPLLARLPTPRETGLAMLDNPSDIDAEAVRRLRSSIEFANLDVNAKAIMVTSAVAQEGKTTTISNLAVALARAGHRVALVDLDLRKPMIGRLFGLELRPGLADVAIERIELEGALVPVQLSISQPGRVGRSALAARRVSESQQWGESEDGHGKLFVLPAGFLPASPGELVGTQAVARILARLRAEMDFVLIDAPPLLTVSDAKTLTARVDAIFLVVRLGRVNRSMLRDLAREFEGSPARKLGFVLTDTDAAELYGLWTYGYLGTSEAAESGSAARRRIGPLPPGDLPVPAERASATLDTDSLGGAGSRGGVETG